MDDSPWYGDGFRLKNIQVRRTVSRKIACIVGMYTSDPSGQFYSLQYESLTYMGGWQGVGRLISDRMSYRNHYMCSGEATSTILTCYTISTYVLKLHILAIFLIVIFKVNQPFSFKIGIKCLYYIGSYSFQKYVFLNYE